MIKRFAFTQNSSLVHLDGPYCCELQLFAIKVKDQSLIWHGSRIRTRNNIPSFLALPSSGTHPMVESMGNFKPMRFHIIVNERTSGGEWFRNTWAIH